MRGACVYEPLAGEDEEAGAQGPAEEPAGSRGEIQNEGSGGEMLTQRSAPAGGIGSILGLGGPAVQGIERLRQQRSLKRAVNTVIASRRLAKVKDLVPGASPGIDMRSSSSPSLSYVATKFQTPAKVTASEYSRDAVHVSQDLSLSDLQDLIRCASAPLVCLPCLHICPTQVPRHLCVFEGPRRSRGPCDG